MTDLAALSRPALEDFCRSLLLELGREVDETLTLRIVERFGLTRQRARLIAILHCANGRPRTAAQLVEVLPRVWGRPENTDPAKLICEMVSKIRRQLGAGFICSAPGSGIGYWLSEETRSAIDAAIAQKHAA